MRFGPHHKLFFNATDGAYSVVTDRESGDPQITVDKDEKAVIYSVISKGNFYLGSKKTGGANVFKKFNLWPSNTSIDVQVFFPKLDKPNELRIYIPQSDPFCPPKQHIWFVFRRNKTLFIGSMPEVKWRSIGRADHEDAAYAESIYEPSTEVGGSRLVKSFQYPRRRSVAINALKRAKFTCEVEPDISLFIARSTGTPYLEPHHLIPMSLQGSFKTISLDHADNVYALSPHHHRRVHFGLPADSQEVIEKLLCRRATVLKKYGVSQADILGFYNCLNID